MNKILNCLHKRKPSSDDIDARRSSSSGAPPSRRFSSLRLFIKPPSGVKISRPTNETHYKNDHPNVGVAVVFNHVYIPGYSERVGTQKDNENIIKSLKLYGFDVRPYNDLSYEEIANVLDEVSTEDHSDNDCLIVIVMSHGFSGNIWAADRPYIVDNLWTPFLGENCESLMNKPKLFFIQACRGNKADVGAVFRSNGSGMIEKSSFSDETDGPLSYTIPSTADTLVFYATVDGYVSFRNRAQGSWFIQSLSILLEQHLKDEEDVDLFKFATSVNRKVAYEYQSNVVEDERLNDMKAMPNFVSTLTKLFILKPKPNFRF